jgi:hypothetical protein
MPNPRKPDHLKLVAGTSRPDRIEPTADFRAPELTECPEAPAWLKNEHAIAEWKVLAPIFIANGLLTAANTSALGQLCALHGKLVQLWSAGETPTGHLMSQYLNLIKAFGLVSLASKRITAPATAGSAPPKNRFERFKPKPA